MLVFSFSIEKWLLLGVFTTLFLASCKGNGPTESEIRMVQKTIVAVTENGDKLTDFSVYAGSLEDKSCSGEELAAEITREANTTLTVCIQADGHKPTARVISFDTDGTVTVTLAKQDDDGNGGETITRTYEIRADGADTLVAGDLYRSDTGEVLNDGSASGEITLPRTDQGIELCTEPQFFAESCDIVIPTDTDRAIVIRADRKAAAVRVDVVDETGDAVENPEITVEDRGNTYTYKAGESTHHFPARAGTRLVRAGKDGYEPDAETITAGADVEVTLTLVRKEELPACSDNDDNDGDGVADENDGGCVDLDGNYDPEDDNEKLEGFQRIMSFSGAEETFFVSGAKDKRERIFIRPFQKLPSSIQIAVSISVQFEKKVSADQSGEEAAIKVKAGPSSDNLNNVNLSEIIPDKGKESWVDVEVTSITKKFFKTGTSYEFYFVHASKIRGESPTNGQDDFVYFVPGRDAKVSITWFYEPEEVNSQAKDRQLQTRQFEVASPINDITYNVREEPIGEQELYRR
ncbi:hypothetical protein [Halalkalibaculum sp. DA384]|uniref:hypothetical protein n=1 Tax=Halalkalibaculum sp. DA384 TaxID=3373606 RepID=UPI003754E6C2